MAGKVYGKQPVKVDSLQDEKKSVINWLLLGFVVMFLLWAPFQKGLFNANTFDFEKPIYTAVIWSSVILFLLAIRFFLTWRIQDHRDLFSLFVLLFPLTYLISLISAASYHYAMNMLYIQIIYVTFFILGSYLVRNRLGFSIIAGALITSGYLVVVFGLLYLLGNTGLARTMVGWMTELVNGVYLHAVMTDSNGIRLTSVFQYANSYAAYLIAILLLASFYLVKSDRWYFAAIHAFLMVPIIISFSLTLSRGAIVILPAVLLIILLFMNIQRQILLLLHLGLAFIASFAVLGTISSTGTQLQTKFDAAQSLQGWLSLLIASFVFTVVAVLIQRYVAPILHSRLEQFSGRKYAVVALPVAAIVIGLLAAILLFSDTGLKAMLPTNVQSRLENINFAQHSVLERGTFYVDAIKLWKDYPIIGAGGGAWSALYEKYQNNPYISRQAHNFFLQYLVETGIVGLLVFVVFTTSILYFFIRTYRKASSEKQDQSLVFLIIMVSLLFHSIIDFDLSYVYLGVLLFLSLGGMLAFTEPVQIRAKIERAAYHKAYPVLILLLSMLTFFFSIRLLSANASFMAFNQMLQSNPNYEELSVPLSKAIELSPNHPDYVLGTSNLAGKAIILDQLYSQTKNENFLIESESLIRSLKQKEPNHWGVLFEQLTHLQIRGQLPQALALADSELSNYPWQISLYEISISLAAELSSQAKMAGNSANMEKYASHALNKYQTVLERMELLKSLPKEQNQGQEFDVTKKIAFSLGQIYFNRGDYPKSAATLKPIISGQMDDVFNRMIARYYLAALMMQNQSDQDLLNKLVAKDPNEIMQIEALTSTAGKR